MSEHTPTPWSVNTMAGNPKREIFSGLRLVCEVIGGQPHLLPENDPQEDAANAAFIVKAVNNHDALVKALRDTLCELTACASQLAARGLPGHPGDSVSRAQDQARAILGVVGTTGLK